MTTLSKIRQLYKDWVDDKLPEDSFFDRLDDLLIPKSPQKPKSKPTDLPHCSGCTDPRSEGTHQGDTIEHWDQVHIDNDIIYHKPKRKKGCEHLYCLPNATHTKWLCTNPQCRVVLDKPTPTTKEPVERVSETKTVEGKIEPIKLGPNNCFGSDVPNDKSVKYKGYDTNSEKIELFRQKINEIITRLNSK